MALTTKQKKQGAVVTAAVGVLALGGVAVSTLGSTTSPADSKPIVAAAVPQPAAAPKTVSDGSGTAATTTTKTPATTTTTGISVTAAADNSKLTDDTVFTVSGEVTGAKPGTRLRLQRQSSGRSATTWTTLAYTTFTGDDNKFSFPVKLESSGTYNLRVEHPQDGEAPETAYSSPFTVTVTATKSASTATSKTSSKTTTEKGSTAKTGSPNKN